MFLLFWIHGLCDSFHQACHVAQSKKPSDEAICFERFEVFKMLTSSQEDNWTCCSSNCAKWTTSFSITVKFSNDDRTNFNGITESFGLAIACLTNTTVHHEDASVWFNSILHLNHFFEECTLLSVPSWRVNYNDFIVVFTEVLYTFICNLYRVCLILMSEEGTFNLCCIHL